MKKRATPMLFGMLGLLALLCALLLTDLGDPADGPALPVNSIKRPAGVAVNRELAAPDARPAASLRTPPASAPQMLALLDRSAAASAAATSLGASPASRDPMFAARSWAAPAMPARVIAIASAPAAPALPFIYLGQQRIDGRVEVFLAQGEQVLAVPVKGQIDQSYRVDSVTPTFVKFTYLPLNLPQQLSTGVND